MDNRSREELIVWLTQIIDRELNKSDDQMDMDLILECSDYLDELQKENYFYKERDIQTKIDIIRQRVQNTATEKKPAKIIRGKRKFPLYKRIILIAAAILLVVMLTTTVVAHTQNYSSLLDFIKDHIAQIRNMPSNDTIHENDVTVTKANETIWYNSIEELLATEGISILYPTITATEDTISSIRKSHLKNDSYYIVILFENPAKQILVNNEYFSDFSQWTTAEIYITHNGTFYIVSKENNIYQASCQYNGYEYTITSDTRDSLIEIINSLKEYAP